MKNESKNIKCDQDFIFYMIMKRPFNIVKRAYIWLFVGVVATVLSWILFISNAQFSEEFTGGVNVTFKGNVQKTEFIDGLTTTLGQEWFTNLKVNLEDGNGEVKVKINAKLEDDAKVVQLSKAISDYLQTENYISSQNEIVESAIIGPSVGNYMQTRASQALIFGIIAMAIYMIFSFGSVRKYINPSILAIVVVLSTILSISIPAGAYGIRMATNSTIQIDTVFIIAILTIIGYGINDVIIIFDRVRENIIKEWERKDTNMLMIFEESIWQTMKRSIGTSLSTILVLIWMFVFATGVVANFAFTVWVWVITSALCSIFIAVPTAYLLLRKSKK